MNALALLLAVGGTWSIGDVATPKPDVPVDQPPQVRMIDTVRQTVSINGETITRVIRRYRDSGEMVSTAASKKNGAQYDQSIYFDGVRPVRDRTEYRRSPVYSSQRGRGDWSFPGDLRIHLRGSPHYLDGVSCDTWTARQLLDWHNAWHEGH